MENQEAINQEENVFDVIIRTGGFPIHCAHRGGGSDFGPENTMYSYWKSVKDHGGMVSSWFGLVCSHLRFPLSQCITSIDQSAS